MTRKIRDDFEGVVYVGSDVFRAGDAEPEGVTFGDHLVEGAKPAGNASLEEWQGYARSVGASDADLEGKTRNELRDKYA